MIESKDDNITDGQMNIYDYNVLLKSDLLSKYEKLKESSELDNIKFIKLSILMPTKEIEIIINPNITEKIEYINTAYDDNLIHRNGNIRIVDYCFINKDETIIL